MYTKYKYMYNCMYSCRIIVSILLYKYLYNCKYVSMSYKYENI